MSKEDEPSWKKWANYNGPSEADRTVAMQEYRGRKGWGREEHFTPSQSNTHRKCDTPRNWKHGNNVDR